MNSTQWFLWFVLHSPSTLDKVHIKPTISNSWWSSEEEVRSRPMLTGRHLLSLARASLTCASDAGIACRTCQAGGPVGFYLATVRAQPWVTMNGFLVKCWWSSGRRTRFIWWALSVREMRGSRGEKGEHALSSPKRQPACPSWLYSLAPPLHRLGCLCMHLLPPQCFWMCSFRQSLCWVASWRWQEKAVISNVDQGGCLVWHSPEVQPVPGYPMYTLPLLLAGPLFSLPLSLPISVHSYFQTTLFIFYCVFLFLEDSLASPILFSVPSIFHGLPFYFPVWGMVTLGRDTDYVHEHSTLHMRCSVQSLMRSASPTLKSAHSRDCFTTWEASSYLEDLAIFGGNWDLISISFYATVNMVLLHLWGCVGILWWLIMWNFSSL